jgi:MoxR-like ATPase
MPEAQLDRFFFKIDVPYPEVGELVEIANRTTSTIIPQAEPVAEATSVTDMQLLARGLPIASHVTEYAANLVKSTHPNTPNCPPEVTKYVRYGASPRAMQAVILAGKIFALLDSRFNVSYADLHRAALPAMRHRIILNFEAQAEGITTDEVIKKLLESLPVEA